MDDNIRLIVELTAETAASKAVAKHAESCPQTKRIIDLEKTVNGHDSSSGLKGIVGSLSQKMSLIQWVVAITAVSVIGATAERFINKPATNEGLDRVNQSILEASDKAAKTAAKTAVELIKADNTRAAENKGG